MWHLPEHPLGNTIEAMQEVLSRPGESDKALKDQKYWIIHIFDWSDSWIPGFAVQQACGQWSDVDGQIMLTDIKTETFATFDGARDRYGAMRLALVGQGFEHSDLDFK